MSSSKSSKECIQPLFLLSYYCYCGYIANTINIKPSLYYRYSVLKIISPITTLLIDSSFAFQVIYEIETNGTFGIQRVSVSFGQTNLTVQPGVSLQQDFTIHFRVSRLRGEELSA
jgi:hypothetical protein